MTAIAFVSFIELDPTRPDPRVDPTLVQLWSTRLFVSRCCSMAAKDGPLIGDISRHLRHSIFALSRLSLASVGGKKSHTQRCSPRLQLHQSSIS